MTKITIDNTLIFFLVLLFLWVFSLGVYIQAHYNIYAVDVPDTAGYCIFGLIIGGLIVHFVSLRQIR